MKIVKCIFSRVELNLSLKLRLIIVFFFLSVRRNGEWSEVRAAERKSGIESIKSQDEIRGLRPAWVGSNIKQYKYYTCICEYVYIDRILTNYFGLKTRKVSC